MGPTSLKALLNEEGVVCQQGCIIVRVHAGWVLEGEHRLSYTTIIRLIECCREHHWNTDIAPISDASLDSITRSIHGDFISPISIKSIVSINYRIAEVRNKSYSLKFEIHDTSNQQVHAIIELVSVFYDSVLQQAVIPPIPVINALRKWSLLAQEV
jgi:acyl-CoA thioesterase FadM